MYPSVSVYSRAGPFKKELRSSPGQIAVTGMKWQNVRLESNTRRTLERKCPGKLPHQASVAFTVSTMAEKFLLCNASCTFSAFSLHRFRSVSMT